MAKNISVRFKIILSGVSILFAAVLIIGLFFSITFYKTMQSNVYKDLNNAIISAEEKISSNFELIENTLFTFFNTSVFREWKNNNIEIPPSDNNKDSITYKAFNEIQKDISAILMFNSAWSNKIIHSSYLIADDKPFSLHVPRSFISNDAENFKNVYEEVKEKELKTCYIPPTSENPFAYAAKKFSNITNTKEIVFITSLDSEKFSEELSRLPAGITASLADKDGTVFFSSDNELIGKKNSFEPSSMKENKSIENGYETNTDGKHTLVVFRQLKDSDFFIVVSAPTSIFTRQVAQSMIGYAIIIVLFLVLFVILSTIVSSVLTKFLSDINISLNRIKKKDYTVTMPSYKEHDLNNISITFNSMTDEIKNLIQKVYRERLLLQEADIKQLQSQMNPHFLINTLTTISTITLMHKDTLLYEMISALTEILDASLTGTQHSSAFISVAQELKYMKCYLYLQQIRFQDKLKYNINVEDDTLLDLYIPRLSIEPLVENAVIHGIEENVNSGKIDVSVRKRQGKLIIEIEDNGNGFDVQKVMNDENSSHTQGHNISIKNISQRFRLIFGNDYGLEFDSVPNVKTIAKLTMPIVTEPYYNREENLN